MSDILFQETDATTGVTLKIIHDGDLENPVEHDDDVRFAVLHGRYVNPAATHGLTWIERIEEFERANADGAGEFEVFSLWLFDHSDTTYRVSPDDSNPFGAGMYARFDSGRVGILALKRSEFWGPTATRADFFKCAESVAAEYTAYANGHGYGYVIEDADGEELESCWGFIGVDDEDTNPSRRHFANAVAKVKADNATTLQATYAADAASLEASRPDLYADA